MSGSGLRHRFEIEVAASPDEVWQAIVDPGLSARYFYGIGFRSTLEAGAAYAYQDAGGAAAVDGTILEVEAPRRLQMTAAYRPSYLFSERVREDPAHRVTWEVEPVEGGDWPDGRARCRVRLTCDQFERETLSFKHAANMMPAALKGLHFLLEPEVRPTRRERIALPVIRELTPELRGDFLQFFDHDAFADNPYWSWCYCTGHHHATHGLRTAAENRQFAGELVGCGRMQGVLAYVNGRPAAWCNAAPRTTLAFPSRNPALAVDDAEQVGAIVCFVVAAPYRRHGIARRLLDAAVERFRRQGLAYAEAYPEKEPGHNGPGGDSDACMGPLELYLGAGFEPFRETGNTVMVRKGLRA